MISISLVVLLNNIVTIMGALCCFFHALHSGLYTNNFTKLVLFTLGLVFFSSTVDVADVIMPGYKYIMFANITFGFIAIWYFVSEAYRFGFAQQWYNSIRSLIHHGDSTNANKK